MKTLAQGSSSLTVDHPGRIPAIRRGGRNLAICALLFLSTLIVYFPSYHAEFVSLDDPQYVIQNEAVRHGSWQNFKLFFTEIMEPSTVKGYYQPLTMHSLMLDAQLSSNDGLDPLVYHITNIVLHACNSILVFFILRIIVPHDVLALLGAAFFVLHPVQVESVSWISQRKTVLATFFALASLLSYLRYAWGRRRLFLALSILFYAAGMLAKPTIMLLPVALLLLDFWPLQRPLRRCLVDKIPFVLVMIVMAYIAWHSQVATARLSTPRVDSLEQMAKWTGLLSFNLMMYLGNIVWPLYLAPYRSIPQDLSFANPAILGATIGAGVLLVSWVTSIRWSRAFFVGLAGFVILLSPGLGGVRFTESCVGDRFLYFPFIFLLIPFVVFLRRLVTAFPEKARSIAVAVASFLVPFVALTWAQQSIWQNAADLWIHIATIAPRNFQANHNVALIYHYAGDFEHAQEYSQRIVDADPKDAATWLRLSREQMRTGQTAVAVENAERALKLGLGPNEGWGHITLSQGYLAVGRESDARRELAAADTLGAVNVGVLTDFAAFALQYVHRCDWSEELYRCALLKQPENLDNRYELAVALRKCGHEPQAVTELEEIVRRATQSGKAHAKAEAELAELRAKGKLDAPPPP